MVTLEFLMAIVETIACSNIPFFIQQKALNVSLGSGSFDLSSDNIRPWSIWLWFRTDLIIIRELSSPILGNEI